MKNTPNSRRYYGSGHGHVQGLGLQGVARKPEHGRVDDDVFSASSRPEYNQPAAIAIANPEPAKSSQHDVINVEVVSPPRVETLPSSDSAPAVLSRLIPREPKPDSPKESSTPSSANDKPAIVAAAAPTTPHNKSGSRPAAQPSAGTPSSKSTWRRGRAHSDPSTPSSAERYTVNHLFTQAPQQPAYPYPDIYYPYMQMPPMFIMQPQSPPSAPGAASPEAASFAPPHPAWRGGYYPQMGPGAMYPSVSPL